jgi:hypothetical protein
MELTSINIVILIEGIFFFLEYTTLLNSVQML